MAAAIVSLFIDRYCLVRWDKVQQADKQQEGDQCSSSGDYERRLRIVAGGAHRFGVHPAGKTDAEDKSDEAV